MIKLSNLHLEMHLGIFLIAAVLLVVFGYLLGRKGKEKLSRRILEVEDEMLHSNNEVLRYAEINKELTEALENAKIQVPTIGLKEEKEKVRDIRFGKIG